MEHPAEIDGHQVLRLLGRGGMGAVYLVKLPGSSEKAALKLLRARTSTELDRLRFEREFRLAQKCQHPYIVPVYSSGFHQESPYYTMEYIPGRNLRDYLSEVPAETRLRELGRLGDCLLQGLVHVHGRSIIHRDLKPENVLVQPDGTPRLLDFGLARPGGGESARLTDPDVVLGTVHYMAPEQVTGGAVDARTDLYALGVLLYELLAGRLPFEGEGPMQVLGQILHREPPPIPESVEAHEGLKDMVLKLMAREPADRFFGAEQALGHWRRLFGRPTTVSQPTLPIPASPFAPRFLGRESELNRLLGWLEAVADGQNDPGLVLVCGPTGVGKSRLLRELATRARAEGRSVYQGQAQEVESIPYQLWLPSLRRCSRADLPPELEDFRGALASLLPHLGGSVGQDLDRRFRLFEGMARLLLSRLGPGSLFVLEDLHWADEPSLEFLRFFTRRLKMREERLLVVASSQDRAEVPTEAVLDLAPLDLEQTEAMMCSMLGGGSLEPPTTQSIYRQTGGNPLFVRELANTLLEEGALEHQGGVWSLAEATEGRRSGGLSRVVREAARRHLEGVGPQEIDILRCAALIGHRFRFALLAEAIDVPRLELLDRLAGLVARAVLRDNPDDPTSFRFHSEPLREAVLEPLKASERRNIHRRIARALQNREPDFEVGMELARHYVLSGDPVASAQHLLAAAEKAEQSFAHCYALDLYRAVLPLPEAACSMPRPVLMEKIADARVGCTNFEEAREAYQELFSRATDGLDQARLLRKIGGCSEALGEWQEAYRCLVRGLELLHIGSGSWNGALQRFMAIHIAPLRLAYQDNPKRTLELSEICSRLERVLFYFRPTGWQLESLNVALLQQVLARALKRPDAAVQAQLFFGYTHLMAPPTRARGLKVLGQAATEAAKLQDPARRAEVLRDVGYLFMIAGEGERALNYCQESASLCQSIGDIPGLAQSQLRLVAIHLHMGETEKARANVLQVIDSAQVRSLSDRVIADSYAARCHAILGQPELALSMLERAEQSDRRPVPFVRLLLILSRAWVEFSLANPSATLETVDKGLRLARKLRTQPFFRMAFHHVRLLALAHPECDDPRAARLESYLKRFESRANDLPMFKQAAKEIKQRLRDRSRR